jgi:hypothetical protein
MALNALLKFTQGILIGADGLALAVAEGVSVTVGNSTGATDVGSWTIELLYAPPGSTLYTLIPVMKAVGGATAPTWVFTPDAGIYGLYRIRLTVYSGAGYTGTRDVDIRNVAVVTPNQHYLVYSPQLDPAPLPSTGVGAKPNEFNFNGQPFGWAGDGSTATRGLNEALLHLDGLVTTVGSPNLHFTIAGGGQTLFPLPASPLSGIVIMVVDGVVLPPYDFTVVADVVHYSGTPMAGGESVSFYYWLGAVGGAPTVIYSAYAFMQGVAGVVQVEVDTFTDVGAILFDPEKYQGVWHFQTVVEVTPTHTAEIRLYNITDDWAVYGATMSTTSNSPVELTADVALGTGPKLYVVQLRLSVGTGGAATCKLAGVEVAGRQIVQIVAPQLTGDVASFNPTGWGTATWVDMSSDASRTVRGMAVAATSLKRLVNMGANPILFTHQDAGAAAAERIITPDGLTFTLAVAGVAYIRYDSTATRWTIV